jgi:tetratricopeptide (TPR) repeat protein
VLISRAPVLLPTPAYAVDNKSSPDAPDLNFVQAKIKVHDYAAALAELRDAEDTQQADVYNLLGFTLRKTGDFTTSLTYYTKALELEPDHKAAREYLGELYVETRNMTKAKEHSKSWRACVRALRGT